MHTTGSRPKLVVSADGRGVVSHAGSRLLADLADVTSLTGAFADALRRLRPRGTGHDPGRIAVDLAVMLAEGGQAIADLALLRDQAGVFGPVASTATAWRLLAGIGPDALARLRSVRATAREVAWLQAAETTGGIPVARAGGRDLPGLVLDIDATLVTCHSEKEQAAATYKRGFGYHPLLCFLDNPSAHKGADIRRWAKKHRVELCFTPAYASWANPIEAHSGPLRQFTIADSNHPNHVVQTRALHACIRWRNANARHRDVLAAERKERARIRSEKGIRWGGRPLQAAA